MGLRRRGVNNCDGDLSRGVCVWLEVLLRKMEREQEIIAGGFMGCSGR